MDRPHSPLSLPEMIVYLAGGTLRDYEWLRKQRGSTRAGPDGGQLRTLPASAGGDGTASPEPPEPEAEDPAAPSPRAAARLARIESALGEPQAARQEFRRYGRAGVRLVAWRHHDFPERLHHLPQPPILLVVRGRWPVPTESLAVVGSRAATPYGRGATAKLVRAAVGAGLPIVSGLARGIDRVALETALDAEGWPVAVLGCGIDVAYPPEHARLQARIAAAGTLVTEFPLGRRPDRFAFPRRNRIIAALARAVLVVEASERSGALITVGHALDLGLEVLAVPGPIDSPTSRGTNRMLTEGAGLVDGTDTLLSLLGRTAANGSATVLASAAQDPLLAVLDERPRHTDELAQRSGLDVTATRAGLIALELQGRAQRIDGGLFVLRRT